MRTSSRLSAKLAFLSLAAAALFLLYFYGLTRTGLLGPDEPRYAAIGQAMSQTGDWITPRLWGHAWFEKPPLLYWMTAAAFQARLNQDLAPRLPVAIISVAFLLFFFLVLRRQFSERAAFYSTAILATSAGWLALSHVAVPDLPMSAAFAASMLLVMRASESSPRIWLVSGALLGLAILGKGLVPLVLFIPAIWFCRSNWRKFLLLLLVAAVIALPWYLLVTGRNGAEFVSDFFWKQQFSRFTSGVLLHARPFWFYVPVFLAGFFPWTPFLVLLLSKNLYKQRCAHFLLAWFVFGFVFFSASRGKLPGYLLPLLPPAAALLGLAIDQAVRSFKTAFLMAAAAALLALIPTVQDLLPSALASGLTRSRLDLPVAWLIAAGATAVAAAFLERAGRRGLAIVFVALLTAVSVLRVIEQTFPVLDRQVSARSSWLSNSDSITCVSETGRFWRYSLDYYARRDLPDCI